MPRPVVHWEIGGKDLPRLREFYHEAFGWTIDDADASYALVQPVDGGLGGGLMRAPEGTSPYVTIYVQVDDLEEALDAVGALGGTIVVPPSPIDDSTSFAMFADPEGNVVGLLTASGPIAGPPGPASA